MIPFMFKFTDLNFKLILLTHIMKYYLVVTIFDNKISLHSLFTEMFNNKQHKYTRLFW